MATLGRGRRGRRSVGGDLEGLDLGDEHPEDVELEGLDADGRGLSGGTRHRVPRRDGDGEDGAELPDEAPPGYPG